jgi:tetratricopeptide (TPR) repeat protein
VAGIYRVRCDARSFHLVVVFLHATASVLLAFVLWQLGVKVIVSGATGLLFLLNASHFQAVHHISALDYHLALIWSILAGLFFLYASRLKSLIYWSGCGFCLAYGLWIHTAVISMIPLFAYGSWLAGECIKTSARRIIALGAIALPVLGLSVYLTPENTALLLAWTLDVICQKLGAKASIFYAIALLALSLSSYSALKRSEAISLYDSGKNAMHGRDLTEGKRQLRRAIDRRSGVIRLGDAYYQLVLLALARREDYRPVLQEGLNRMPYDVRLNVINAAMQRLQNGEVGYRPSPKDASLADSTSGNIYHLLGLQAEMTGDYMRAAKAYIAGIDYEFWRDQSRTNLLRVISGWKESGQRAGRSERELLHSLLDKGMPEAKSGDYTRLGIDLGEWGLSELSLTAYRRALEVDEGNLVAHTNLGWILYQQRDYLGAIEQFRRALEQGPHSVAAFNLGLAQLAADQVSQAEKQYAEAVERYGAEEAQRIGAVQDLRELASSATYPAAQKMLTRYWSTAQIKPLLNSSE